ncbi:hypothetical protein HAX54_013970 [Datura stramonium]|uniref:Cytochrome P450 n=1 Tax=Datura stramonium TaxID=4076 RepID=A0ABS8TP38_DATST|nr:hypothetical protein [Datura stramonium]
MDYYVAFSLVILFALALFFIPSESRKKQQLYPKSYPLISCLVEFIRNRERIILWTSEIFDKLSTSTYVLQIPFGRSVVFTRNPSNVQHILKTRFYNYHKESTLTAALSDFFGKGLFLVDGAEWKSQRQFVRHVFDPKEYHAYISIAEEELSDRLDPFLSKIAAQENACSTTLDLQNTFRRLTFDLVCRIGFGFDPKYLLPSMPSTPLADTYETAVKLSMGRYTTLPLIWKAKKLFNAESEKKLGLVVEQVHKFLGSIIAKKKERLVMMEDLEDKDVFARLLRRAQSEVQLNETFLVDEAVNFILGGQDTLCSALTWFFWLVSSNPNVDKEIAREVREKDGLSDMVYTHASIYESMRLFPPIPVETKQVAEDDVWPDGTKVKKGMSIIYHILAMGRSSELWGSDWAYFRPERWLEKRSSDDDWNFIARDPFMYPVFQAGPRSCLGKEIAIVLMKMVAATILKRFRVLPAKDNFSPHYDASMTSKMKHGFPGRCPFDSHKLMLIHIYMLHH